MNENEYFASRELSQKLKDAGVKQESLFFWVNDAADSDWIIALAQGYDWYEGYSYFENKISAFTLGEICDRIPGIVLIKNRGGCSASYGTFTKYFEWSGENLIEAATNLLILLINEKEITP